MTLLPEKFSRPQKQPRPHFPTDDVCPLIDEDRQIPVRLHPSRVAGADDSFRSGPDHKRLRQRTGRFHLSIPVDFQAGVRDDGAFFGEAFNVFRFLGEITQRNEKWEISIAMASGAKHGVELTLHVFPNSVTPGSNHHATAYVRGLSQLRRAVSLLIPLWKVLVAARRDRRVLG